MTFFKKIKNKLTALQIRYFYKNVIVCSDQFSIGDGSMLIVATDSKIKFHGSCNIECNVILRASYQGNIEIGENVFIGDYSTIRATDSSSVIIGANTMIAQNVKIISTNHNYADKNMLIKHQHVNESKKGVTIGSDCWLAAGVTILPGVTLGDGVVIGANSLVTKNIPDYAVAVGSPAKIIKYRE